MKRAFLRSGRAAALVLLIFLCGSGFATGQPARPFTELAVEYEREVLPVLKQFCLKCHSGDAPQGDLDLQRFKTLREVRRGTGTWIQVVELLANGEMPPADAPQPAPRQRKVLRVWAEQYLRAEALASAGDPGPVVLRRLNNAEYTFTLRDLTGVALNPARAFPSEGAAGEGFTNTGNALVMSPGLLRKYLDAGKEIAAHAVLLPAGFRFSANTTRRDWTDECLSAIRGFYGEYSVVERLADHYGHGMSHLGKAGRLPLERYFAATLAERAALQSGDKTIADVAAQASLNAKYLGSLWSALTAADDGSFLLDQLRAHWRQAAPDAAAVLTRQVRNWQKGVWTFNPVGLLGRKGSRSRWMEAVSPLLTQHELQFPIPAPQEADKTNAFIVSLVAGDAGDGNEHDFVVWTQPRLVAEGKPDVLLRDWLTASGKAIAADSVCVQAPSVITVHVPAELTGRMLVTTATLAPKGASGSVQTEVVAGTPADPSGLRPSEVMVKLEHVNIGADKRTVSYRRPILVGAKSAARRRFATALEDFRKLFPAALCYTQIVPVDELLTLTLLYREDDHLARLMLDDAQTARLDALWEELRYVSHEPIRLVDVLDSLLETTIDHPQAGIFDDAVKSFNARADAFRKKLLASEVIHVDALVEFAARVWRRPLTTREETDLRNLYERLRQLSLSHEEAFRLSLARVFVASPFLYRLEVPPEGTDPAPVTDRELASRLSYFLWSSMPDETLRSVVDNGTLHTPAVLIGQAQRMLKDARVRRLATEFACHWLHIHDFDPLVQKSEKYFPEFAELRGAMYEESIRFLTDLFQTDGSLLSLLNADHTFLNGPLAEFYGVPGVTGATWRRIEGIQQMGRGGILGWATTLAKQSGATRTSPILRGNWISEVLLGEKLPKPPKNVPQLAAVIPPGLTERQLIQRHSRDAACAKCHARIDPFGFALEHFNGIGRWRDKDASGLAIDSQTTLPDGTQIDGLAGLRDYLLQQRRDDFLRQFCRKLLGYALGREIQLSDRPLVDAMLARLAASDYRFTAAVETIVLSQQFRMIRGKSLGD